MTTTILNQLQELQQKSGKNLHPVVLATLQDHSNPRTLVKSSLIANGQHVLKPVNGTSSLTNPRNRSSRRKVNTLNQAPTLILNKLNTALLGGERYPILTAAIGIAGAAISGGAGLLFTLSTTGLALANTAGKVLARPGDEIWHIEEIGKEGNKAIYISAFFIVDPYRKQAPDKGWLIHEERKEVPLT